MFGPLLSGSAFGLSEGPSDWNVEFARCWSGNSSLIPLPDGSLKWPSKIRLDIGRENWYEAPPSLTFSTQSALISLGSIGGVVAFAFVSPFPIATAFRQTASKHLRRIRPSARIVDFALDFSLISTDLQYFSSVRGKFGLICRSGAAAGTVRDEVPGPESNGEVDRLPLERGGPSPDGEEVVPLALLACVSRAPRSSRSRSKPAIRMPVARKGRRSFDRRSQARRPRSSIGAHPHLRNNRG
jgi:hypothetical protein